VSLREEASIMKKRNLGAAFCLLGLMVAVSNLCLCQAAAAEDGRRLGPLTKLLIEKGVITRHELELEDAVYEPEELPVGAPVRHLGGIVTSLLVKKAIITQDEMIEAIRIAIKKGETGKRGSPLVSLLVKKDVITANDGRKVLGALGITPPEKPAPPVQKEPQPSVEEKPAAEELTALPEPEPEVKEPTPIAQPAPPEEEGSAPVEQP